MLMTLANGKVAVCLEVSFFFKSLLNQMVEARD